MGCTMEVAELKNSGTFQGLSANGQASFTRLTEKADESGKINLMDVLVEYAKISKAKKKPEDRPHKHGPHGHVRLTDAEHTRLIKDYGEPAVTHMIAYIDGRAQETGNRCGWKDWNAVIRRGIREGWGPRQGPIRQQPQDRLASRAMRPPQRTYTADDLKHIGVRLLDDE